MLTIPRQAEQGGGDSLESLIPLSGRTNVTPKWPMAGYGGSGDDDDDGSTTILLGALWMGRFSTRGMFNGKT